MKRTRALLNAPSQTDSCKLFEAICMDVCENVDSDLGSVWLFDKHHTKVVCRKRYDALSKEFSQGISLAKADYPDYFKHIVEDNIVSAPQAQTQLATREFTETYFKPLGIVSLLDFILHRDFKPVGVICCENRRGIRNWTEANQNYLRSIAALTSFNFKLDPN